MSEVKEIISIVHKLLCFGVVFSPCLFTGWLLFLPHLLSLGQGQWSLTAGPLLSAFFDGLLIIFQFWRAIWLWVLGGMPRDSWCSCAWSAKCLPNRFVASSWWQQHPICFLSVIWHRKAFYGLGVQAVEVLILLGALFPLSVAWASQ
jgi:hypothetical protein